MEITFLQNDIEFWIQARRTPPRTDGLHVSVLVLAMLQEVSKHFRTWNRGDRPERNSIYEMGYAWEDALAGALAARAKYEPHEKLIRPKELELDHIYGTPDRLLYDSEQGRLVDEEIKLTWMSCKGIEGQPDDITTAIKFQYWLMQKKCYLAMLHFGYAYGPGNNTLIRRNRYIMPSRRATMIVPTEPPIGRVRALFVNGSYTGDLAKPLGWELKYTAEELSTFWASVLRFRDEHYPLQTTGAA